MPIYEYRCNACSGEFEYQQRMSDDPKTVCESCGGELERLISRTSFHLKGSGWYKDLYASPKPDSGSTGKEATAKDSTAGTSSDSGSSSGSDSSSSSGSGSGSSASPGSSSSKSSAGDTSAAS